MTIWPVGPDGEVRLTRWRVYRTDKGEDHFVGYNAFGKEGRVSGTIVEWKSAERTGYTESGQEYILSALSGKDKDTMYVWDLWKTYNGVKSDEDVTEEYGG